MTRHLSSFRQWTQGLRKLVKICNEEAVDSLEGVKRGGLGRPRMQKSPCIIARAFLCGLVKRITKRFPLLSNAFSILLIS
jgi:hypothetical protein